MSKRKKKKILFYAVSFTFFLLLMELSARILFFVFNMDIKAFNPSSDRYINSAFVEYALKPNFELNHNTIKESYNSFGFKSPEFNVIKNDSTYRIIVLGGSSAYGNFDNDKIWSHFLSYYLNKSMNKVGENNYEVINTGVPGYNTFNSLGLLFSKIIDLDPDLIILYQLWNDFSYFPELNDSTLYHRGGHKNNNNIFHDSYMITSLSVISRLLRGKITNEKFLPPSKTINTYNTYGLKQYKRNVEILAMVCKKYNIELLLSSQLTLYKSGNSPAEIDKLPYGHTEYYLNAFNLGNNSLMKISNSYDNTYYFNPSKYIETNLDVLLDHIHPTVEGNDLLAKYMSRFIIENILYKTE